MRRIQTANKQVDKFGAGKHGFSAGNPTGGVLATFFSPDWCDFLQEELMSVIEASGQAEADTRNQVLQALAILARSQAHTALTSAGAAPTFTLTPTFPFTAYAAGQRWRVKFNVNGSGADTLNVSGLGAKALKQYDSTGSKVAAVIAAGQLADVEYDGADFVILDPLPVAAPSICGAFKNLQASASGLSAAVSVTVDEIVVESATNAYQTLRNVALTIAGTASGVANGLDSGALAASTWYSLWVVWNGTTVSGLLSLSTTAPTLPAGYTHKARIGWVRTDGTANKYPLSFKQAGRRVQYVPIAGSNLTGVPAMASGSAASPGTSLSSVSVGNYVPPTASSINILAYQVAGSSNVIQVASNVVAGYTTSNGITVAGTAVSIVGAVELILESSNIYWASIGATNQLSCSGWMDNF